LHQTAPLPWGQSAQVEARCPPHETSAEQTFAKSTTNREYQTIARFVVVSMLLIVFDDAICFFVREIHPWTTFFARMMITLEFDKTFGAFPEKYQIVAVDLFILRASVWLITTRP
jgi:hypothetical protein